MKQGKVLNYIVVVVEDQSCPGGPGASRKVGLEDHKLRAVRENGELSS